MTPLSSRALRSPVPRRAVLAAAAGGLVAAGCSTKTRTRVVEAPAPPAPPAPPPAAPPVEATQGQLVSAHTRATGGIGWTDPNEPHAPPGRWVQTPAGVWVWLPVAVELTPGRAGELLAQVDATEPEGDTRIPAGTRLPPGSRVIPLPGAFAHGDAWAVGLAGGPIWVELDGSMGLVCWVSWRPAQSEPRLLPALAHELRHLLTGDPISGHPGGCCNRWSVTP